MYTANTTPLQLDLLLPFTTGELYIWLQSNWAIFIKEEQKSQRKYFSYFIN